MSDAKGPASEPGEPVAKDTAPDAAVADDATVESTPAETGAAEASPAEVDANDTGDVPASRREARETTGATDVVATPQDDASVTRPSTDEPAPAEEPDYAALAADLDDLENRGASTTVTTRSATSEAEQERRPDPWFEPADKTQTFTATDAYDAPDSGPVVTSSEPAAPASTAPVAPAALAPVFVQAPEPPRKRGNRGAAGLIGILAALVFAVLYFGATLGYRALLGDVTLANAADASLEVVTSLGFWTTVVAFFLGFWLLGALINRARWGAWVILGLFVGVVAYLGHVAGHLVSVEAWRLTLSEALIQIEEQLLSPLAIAAFVFGREITIWFGAWVARRGARVTERNAEAQAEYERTLEAGPRLD